jgi:hypothetical protein
MCATRRGRTHHSAKGAEGTRVGLNPPATRTSPPFAGSFYSFSFGANYALTDYLVFRPELRADWFDGASTVHPFQDGSDDNRFMLGFDVIVRI